MSPLTSLRSAAALFLVALLLSTSLFIPTAVGATGYPEQTIRLLIVYDDTYAASMERNEILGDLNHRLEQMTRLAEIPFNEVWNISFDITVLPYTGTFNAFDTEPYVNSCPDIHYFHYDTGKEQDTPTEVWNSAAQCNCFNNCFVSLSSDCHHNSAKRILVNANTLCLTSNDYDAVGVYVAHLLCYEASSGEHSTCGGLSFLDGCAFTGHGDYDLDLESQTRSVENILSNRGMLWHEFSHCFGLPDGSNDFTNPSNCTENYPCTMSGGFAGVVYTGNVWCPNCQSQFNFGKYLPSAGGAN